MFGPHTQTVGSRELRALGDFVRERRCRMGIVIHNDREPRLYEERIVGDEKPRDEAVPR